VLDIDSLDRSTLHRLHEFVTGESLLKHKKSPLAKKQRNYGEHATERKIRELEKTLQKFNSGKKIKHKLTFIFVLNLSCRFLK
jgi:bromodomain-containing factor 1